MRIISSQSFFLYAARPIIISTVDSGAEKSPVSMAPVPPPPTVISTGTEQSGVEWRNLRPQRHRPHCGGRSLDSEYQWSSNAFILIPTCSSARDDMLAGSSQSWGTETNDTDTTPSHLSFRLERSKAEWSGVEWRNLRSQWYQCLPLPLSFRPQRSKAEWSGEISGSNGASASPAPLSFRPQRSVVEKSPDSVGQAPMRWEISRLRVSMIYKYFIPISTRSPARDDMWVGSEPSLWEFQSIEAKKKEL